jgi:hypothetical protein
MATPPERLCALCFVLLLALGAFCLVIGVVLVPVLPHFQLDAVLTPREMADARTREATLALLRRASGNMWLFWAAVGLVGITVSAVGLRAAKRLPRRGP